LNTAKQKILFDEEMRVKQIFLTRVAIETIRT
jgi:hypothetical protein